MRFLDKLNTKSLKNFAVIFKTIDPSLEQQAR